MYNKLSKTETEFETKVSGWSLKSIDGLQLRINLVNPLKISTFIPLLVNIAAEKTAINIKNTQY